MTAGDSIRVLVVDDHPVVRAGIAAIVGSEADLDVIGTAANGTDAIALFKIALPDVCLVDLSLPDMSGIDLIRALRDLRADAEIVVLTARTGGNDIDCALRVGAGAYLFKDAPPEELIAAVRTVARGGRYLPPSVGRKAAQGAADTALTRRERDVLLWLARGHSNKQIADDLGIGEETVKSHIKNILEKLHVGTRSEAIALSLRSGVLHTEDF